MDLEKMVNKIKSPCKSKNKNQAEPNGGLEVKDLELS